VDGDTMVAGCAVAFFAHIVLHTLALKFPGEDKDHPG
jgi:hypothetical protein